ncbi:SDR family NAD(P)-dependent oxidoreductase [Sphingobium baderi]|uniref:Alcohol dehydrogenase n=1 Tax=Sphingobium baderi TaxID=1332080 RepID=A0A0S3F4C1_9SPHN|nr:SDR family NAD(P)-dependent oxidoreductase [Sphingobium baderi]ALR22524.1 alcohol dehydrogenase [Sphingobium baderi]
MNRLQGKTAVITGAGSGIGRATALLFAKQGAAVVIADLNGEAAKAVAKEIVEAGGRSLALTIDVGEEEQLGDMIQRTVDEYGTIDILFNNAVNTAAGKRKPDVSFLQFDKETFHDVVNVNVLGGVLATRFALPHMLKQGRGSILFTSSTSSLAGDVSQFSYGASKAMVNWYVQTIATCFGADGIRCNAIIPGVIETPAMKAWANGPMHDAFMKLQNGPRLGLPEDIAAMALFLASDEAAYCNGALYKVDGGITAQLPFAQLQRDFLLPERVKNTGNPA